LAYLKPWSVKMEDSSERELKEQGDLGNLGGGALNPEDTHVLCPLMSNMVHQQALGERLKLKTWTCSLGMGS
jgi:hypothetical protein